MEQARLKKMLKKMQLKLKAAQKAKKAALAKANKALLASKKAQKQLKTLKLKVRLCLTRLCVCVRVSV